LYHCRRWTCRGFDRVTVTTNDTGYVSGCNMASAGPSIVDRGLVDDEYRRGGGAVVGATFHTAGPIRPDDDDARPRRTIAVPPPAFAIVVIPDERGRERHRPNATRFRRDDGARSVRGLSMPIVVDVQRHVMLAEHHFRDKRTHRRLLPLWDSPPPRFYIGGCHE
jgi:hypothetical protein